MSVTEELIMKKEYGSANKVLNEIFLMLGE